MDHHCHPALLPLPAGFIGFVSALTIVVAIDRPQRKSPKRSRLVSVADERKVLEGVSNRCDHPHLIPTRHTITSYKLFRPFKPTHSASVLDSVVKKTLTPAIYNKAIGKPAFRRQRKGYPLHQSRPNFTRPVSLSDSTPSSSPSSPRRRCCSPRPWAIFDCRVCYRQTRRLGTFPGSRVRPRTPATSCPSWIIHKHQQVSSGRAGPHCHKSPLPDRRIPFRHLPPTISNHPA